MIEEVVGFAAHTLVATERGSVPIQDIKVGDRVLSQNPGSEEEPRPAVVRKLYRREGASVLSLHYIVSPAEARPWKSARITCSRLQEVWEIEEGHRKHEGKWTKTRDLGRSFVGRPYLLRPDGAHFQVYGEEKVCATDNADIGWIPYIADDLPGLLFDFSKNESISTNAFFDQSAWPNNDTHPLPFKTTLFSFEVGGYSSFFVGDPCVLVHDATTLYGKKPIPDALIEEKVILPGGGLKHFRLLLDKQYGYFMEHFDPISGEYQLVDSEFFPEVKNDKFWSATQDYLLRAGVPVLDYLEVLRSRTK